MNLRVTCRRCGTDNVFRLHNFSKTPYGNHSKRFKCCKCRYPNLTPWWKFIAYLAYAEDTPIDPKYKYITKFFNSSFTGRKTRTKKSKKQRQRSYSRGSVECPSCKHKFSLNFFKPESNITTQCPKCSTEIIYVYKTIVTTNIYPYRGQTAPDLLTYNDSNRTSKWHEPVIKSIPPKPITILRKQVSL